MCPSKQSRQHNRVLAVDPGKLTGWAILEEGGQFWSGEDPHHDFLLRTEKALYDGVFDMVVAERFNVTAATLKKSRGEMWSLRQLGCLEYWCKKLAIPYDEQLPSDAMGFASNDRLKELGWYRPGHGGHANDAARHLLLYAARYHRYNGHIVT